MNFSIGGINMQNLFVELFEEIITPAAESCYSSTDPIDCNDCATSGCSYSCSASCEESCFNGDDVYTCNNCSNACTGTCGTGCVSTCRGWVVNYK